MTLLLVARRNHQDQEIRSLGSVDCLQFVWGIAYAR